MIRGTITATVLPAGGTGAFRARPVRAPGKIPSLCLLLAALSVGSVKVTGRAAPEAHPSPDQIYGTLFADVQRARVFPDQKTFADCVPKGTPGAILAAYKAEKEKRGNVDLKRFVLAHFLVPETQHPQISASANLEDHLRELWDVLRRNPAGVPAGSSLLPLPYPYVVPGGRFREVYYWDSYFTMLGLREAGRDDLIGSMVGDFAHELATYGLIPNGNRTYYLSRSQPPFFSLMVELLAESKGEGVYKANRPALAAEYAYWMDRTFPTRHVVHLPDGGALNRYFDRCDTPRPEAFADDEKASRVSMPPTGFFRDIRSAAESGWDFSSRWLGDGTDLATIKTTEIVPVDLNCLLFHLESTLAKACALAGDPASAGIVRSAAERRKAALLRACWSQADGFFFDFDLASHRRSPAFTLAGVAPLFFRLATQAQADAVAETIRARFLRAGGVVTTLIATGQQWDAPNGWAPLQWMTIRGLANYGHGALAADIAGRWIKLNRDVYRRTGKMMEKYNVEDTSLPAGGGEYPSQDGFGWTNGVLLSLMRLYPGAEPVQARPREAAVCGSGIVGRAMASSYP